MVGKVSKLAIIMNKKWGKQEYNTDGVCVCVCVCAEGSHFEACMNRNLFASKVLPFIF